MFHFSLHPHTEHEPSFKLGGEKREKDMLCAVVSVEDKDRGGEIDM